MYPLKILLLLIKNVKYKVMIENLISESKLYCLFQNLATRSMKYGDS